jgi:hypothetical protein
VDFKPMLRDDSETIPILVRNYILFRRREEFIHAKAFLTPDRNEDKETLFILNLNCKLQL